MMESSAVFMLRKLKTEIPAFFSKGKLWSRYSPALHTAGFAAELMQFLLTAEFSTSIVVAEFLLDKNPI